MTAPYAATAAADLVVDGLSVSYPQRGRPVHAVREVSLRVAKGEALGIVGESGSGKSTLALALAGLLRPAEASVTARRVAIGDIVIDRLDNAARTRILGRRLGFVFQNPQTALNPVLSIGRQMTDHIRWHLRLSQKEAWARAAALLADVGIADADRRMATYPHEFSGGMLQRVMIAIAIACDPEWLIADEPTTALDASVQADVVDLVARLRRDRGLGLVWITHDLALLSRIADHVAVMYAGEVVEIGPVATLYDSPRHPYSRALLASVRSLWDQESGPFQTIEGGPPDLAVTGAGCPFRPRCPKAFGRCFEAPTLAPLGQDHAAACWAETGDVP